MKTEKIRQQTEKEESAPVKECQDLAIFPTHGTPSHKSSLTNSIENKVRGVTADVLPLRLGFSRLKI